MSAPTNTISEPSARSFAMACLFVIGFLGISVGITYLAYRLQKIIFPYGTFLLGQEQHRFEILEKYRWGVGVAFVVSFIVGL